jgi:hypothetical protein
MRQFSALAASFAVVPTLAFAHVTVAPRCEARCGAAYRARAHGGTGGDDLRTWRCPRASL